jgi:hypothetical protein
LVDKSIFWKFHVGGRNKQTPINHFFSNRCTFANMLVSEGKKLIPIYYITDQESSIPYVKNIYR